MRRSGTGSQGPRFRPTVEALEDRTVPAGGVTARVFDGVLYIAGDTASNAISVTGIGDNTVLVQSLDGTTAVNGAVPSGSGLRIGGVKVGVHAVMGAGDDVLLLNKFSGKGNVNIDMGDGNDFVQMLNAGHRGDTKFLGGSGNDTIDMRIGSLRKAALVDTGTGNDQVNMAAISGRGSMKLFNTGGTDFFSGQNFVFKSFSQSGFLTGTQQPAIDTTAPSVSLSSSTANLINSGTVDFVATFSEDVTGFGAGGITVTNGSVTSFTQVDARTYRFSVTPAGQGVVAAQVNAGAATDAGGNGNTASNSVSRTFDSTAPATPTFDLAGGSDSGTIGDQRTDQTNIMLAGIAEANSLVTLRRATSGTAPGTGTLVATTTADATGRFFFATALNVGPNSLVITATDAAGNVSNTFAQTFTLNTAPTGTAAATNATVGTPTMVDLTTVFSDAERVARMAVSYPTGQTGSIDINLFANAAPNTVANFLQYANNVNSGANYSGSIFHRSLPGFVLQGGGFKFDDPNNSFPALTDLAAVNNEPNISNTKGTIAFAKQPNQPNSATNEFFFNLADNSANLDVQNSGFSVFGQVMNGGQSTVNAISALPTTSVSGVPGGGPLPIRSGANTTSFPQNITAADLATITGVTELTQAQKMMFSIENNSAPLVATATVDATNGRLNITPLTPGTAVFTISATDLDGSVTQTTVTVTVTA